MDLPVIGFLIRLSFINTKISERSEIVNYLPISSTSPNLLQKPPPREIKAIVCIKNFGASEYNPGENASKYKYGTIVAIEFKEK